MKKQIFVFMLLAISFCESCAFVFGGPITDHQRKKPNTAKGEPKREIRVVPLLADIFLTASPIPLIVDFATGAIYKPLPNKK